MHAFALLKTSCRRLEDVFRLRLQEVWIKTNMFALALRLQKTSARRLGQDQYIRLGHTFSRRLQDIFKTSCQDVLQRSLQDVFKTYHQVKLRSIQYVSERFFSKEVYLQRYLPMWHCFWEIYGQCTKFAREVKISRVLVFLFTTPFSRCLQKHF